MFIKFSLTLFLSCSIFVEGTPLMSVSRDLNVIFSCNSTYPVDKKILNVVLIEKRFENVDEQFKCFLHCLYRAYNWMNSDGMFQFEEMRKTLVESTLDEPSIEYLVITCCETEMKNKCERAFSFTECFWTENEKLEQAYEENSY